MFLRVTGIVFTGYGTGLLTGYGTGLGGGWPRIGQGHRGQRSNFETGKMASQYQFL